MPRHHLASLQGDGAPYILASRRQRGSWILHSTAPDKRVPCRTLGHQGLVLLRPAALVHKHRAESLAVSDTDNLRKLLTEKRPVYHQRRTRGGTQQDPRTSQRGGPHKTHERPLCIIPYAALAAKGLSTSTRPTWPCAKCLRGQAREKQPTCKTTLFSLTMFRHPSSSFSLFPSLSSAPT